MGEPTTTVMYPLLQSEELLKIINTPELVVLDAGSKEQYNKAHIRNALFADLNTMLADIKPNAANGGRHPLPKPEQFCKTLGDMGISPESRIVVYDDKSGAHAAARLWWMLRALGHKQVQVLNGGLQAAVKSGITVDAEAVNPPAPKNYPIVMWQLPAADMEEVDAVKQLPEYTIIDVRDAYRYNGESEPIDTIAGHIPGAINMPYVAHLNNDGLFLTQEQLHTLYHPVFKTHDAGHIIVHCGSGVTACHTLLAMAAAGYEIPKLYVGSWSEWSRNGKEMVTQKK